MAANKIYANILIKSLLLLSIFIIVEEEKFIIVGIRFNVKCDIDAKGIRNFILA